jgi:catechol 2,3-dioxygenase-like lactoylglutathione lyase family enzyme
LRQTCLITRNFAQLVQFYREVLRIQPKPEGAEYAEFRTGIGTLAIFSAEAQERYVPGETDPASNKSAILEFEVVDVDAEYARLQPLVAIWAKRPSDQPWGTRSVHFRDPDGNLVDFYAWVHAGRP